ncbi:MAG: phage tail tape measure protein, partial [Prevotella sp.]|nr:phage tail tape measure protein [Prevotella sp.]
VEAQTLAQTLSSIKVNKNLTTQINALTKHYKAVAEAQAKITANSNKQAIADEKLKQQQNRTAQGLVDLQIKQQRLENAQKKTTISTDQLQKKFANLLTTLKSLKNAYPQGTFDSIEQSVRANLKAAQDGSKGVEELGEAYNKLSRDLAVTRAETEKVTTAVVKSGDGILSLAKKFFLWQVTATLVMKPLRAIQDGLSSINETLVKTEDFVISLQRVLPSGSASDSEISSRLYQIAADYGQTIENVQQIATNFARSGMSWADTIKATEAAVLALNVAELDAEEATTGIIAIMSQFGLEASDLERVIDELNKTADNFPVTTEKILAALQRTGSAADNANLSLEETIALTTALSKATGRSGENIGT